MKNVIKCRGGGQWVSTPQKEEDKEKMAFDDLMIGVKGLADTGLTKLPSIFVHDHIQKAIKPDPNDTKFQVPVIDIAVDGGAGDNRAEIVNKLRDACESWGFFLVVNHGIPQQVIDKVIKSMIAFHEMDMEEKREYYTRDGSKRVIFNCNNFMYNVKEVTWKDTLVCKMAPAQPDWEDLPEICRDIMEEYGKHILRVGTTLYELLAETLGIDKNYFLDMGGVDGLYLKALYSPACPEPELTLGSTTHTDFGLLTIGVQNEIGGLQALHEGEFVEPPYIPGALFVNLGDMIQIMTNEKYKSVHHRAVVKNVGPRLNLSGFLRPNQGPAYLERKYGPIKELLSNDNPPKYRSVTLEEYISYYTNKGFGNNALHDFKLEN
jgi:isopenicillin N synthase-like dioxygenase